MALVLVLNACLLLHWLTLHWLAACRHCQVVPCGCRCSSSPHPIRSMGHTCHAIPSPPPSGAPRKVTGLSQGPTSPNTRPGARIVKAYVGSVRRRREEMCQSVGVMEQWPSKRARPLLAMKGGCTRHERRQEWSKRIDSSYI